MPRSPRSTSPSTRTPSAADTVRSLKRTLVGHAVLLGLWIAVLYGLELVDTLLGGRLDAFGIRPRTWDGLWGILAAPFLHGGFAHLLANTGPLVVLGWFVLVGGTLRFAVVSVVVTVLGGLGVWLFGRGGTVHLGASGLIFGYLGYLLLVGWFERKPTAIAGSLVVAGLYGGLVWGVLPASPDVSWEGHLFGFLSGILAAWLVGRRALRR